MALKAKMPDFSAECEVHVPEADAQAGDFISRWSNTNVSLPTAAIIPACEDDIVAAVRYAAENGLKLVPADGTHGTFVPIKEQCLYLDMRKFNRVDLNENAETVTMGGGTVTRDVVRVLSGRDFYTSVPNSNAVGMIGYCLGGGSSSFNGLKGLAIDNILCMRIITASGNVLELSSRSTGEEGELFNVLCGAGFGFGVITSLTLRAWPIEELRMEDSKMWTRKLIFAPPAIHTAAELFTKLQRPEPELMATLLFMRAPPSAPRPGAPMILLNVNYLGPASEAEVAAAVTFDTGFTSKAIVAETSSTSLGSMNDMAEPLNRHGDFKEMYAAWVSSVSASAIVSAFERWVRFGKETPEAKATSYVILAAKSTKGMLENDVDEKKLFPRAIRGRNVFVQITPWWTDEGVETKARSWAAEMLDIMNAPQHDGLADKNPLVDGERLSAFAANLSKGIDVSTVWPTNKLEEIRRLKKAWDAHGVFWNPVVNGV